MQKAWETIELMVREKWRHRKGFRLGEVDGRFIIDNAMGELFELSGDPGNVFELADLIGVLIHYAVHQGWSMDQVEAALLQKLGQRFTKE